MIKLIINDREITTDVSPTTPLVDFFRENQRLLGTKIGCREGDCGACTAIIGELVDGKVQYRSVASCLMPIINVHGKHVVTIEGINPETGLNPIQNAFKVHGGTQCGFCTPAFIMSLTDLALSNKDITMYNLESSVDGNICRCTGYKSIQKALEDLVSLLGKRDKKNPTKWLVKNGFVPPYFEEIEERLKSLDAKKLVCENPDYIVAGGTDIYVEEFDNVVKASNPLSVWDMPELKGIIVKDGKCDLGASTTIEEMRHDPELKKIFPKLEEYTKLHSSTIIRNMATLAGNFVNGAPVGDMTSIFMALDAVLVTDKREILLKDLYCGYKKTILEKREIVKRVLFDAPDKNSFFHFEKISKRRFLDISVVNSAMKIVVNKGVIQHVSAAAGGVGPTIIFLEKMCDFLKGQKLSNETFRRANEIAQTEISPRSRADYKRLSVKTQLFSHMSKAAPKDITLEALV